MLSLLLELQKNSKKAKQRIDELYQKSQHYKKSEIHIEKDFVPFQFGLKNYGSSCYINSSLQCLINLKRIAEILMQCNVNYKYIIEQEDFTLFYKLVCMLRENYNLNANQETFNRLVLEFQINFFLLNKDFQKDREEDAGEFIISVLNYMDEVFSAMDLIVNYEMDNFNVEKNIFLADFQILTKQVCTCFDKNHSSVTNSKTIMLTLEIENMTTLLESIESYFKIENMIDKENLYFCQNCNKKVLATRKMNLISLPNILIIMLKRFKFKVTKEIFNSINYLKKMYFYCFFFVEKFNAI